MLQAGYLKPTAHTAQGLLCPPHLATEDGGLKRNGEVHPQVITCTHDTTKSGAE